MLLAHALDMHVKHSRVQKCKQCYCRFWFTVYHSHKTWCVKNDPLNVHQDKKKSTRFNFNFIHIHFFIWSKKKSRSEQRTGSRRMLYMFITVHTCQFIICFSFIKLAKLKKSEWVETIAWMRIAWIKNSWIETAKISEKQIQYECFCAIRFHRVS